MPKVDLGQIGDLTDDPAFSLDLDQPPCQCGHRHGSGHCSQCDCSEHSSLDPEQWEQAQVIRLKPVCSSAELEDSGLQVTCVTVRDGMRLDDVIEAAQDYGATAQYVNDEGVVLLEVFVVTIEDGPHPFTAVEMTLEQLVDYLNQCNYHQLPYLIF